MASIKRKSSGGGGANWMDTYGDMVTLLLCFFVLLYSMSTISQEKWEIIAKSFNPNASDTQPIGPIGSATSSGGNAMPTTQEMESALQELYDYLVEVSASDNSVLVSKGDGYVFISFDDTVFFDGDSYTLRPEGRRILDTIIPALDKASPFIDELCVLGHTAQAQPNAPNPIPGDRFLASNRATVVVVYLQQHMAMQELDPGRLVVKSFGQWRPVSPNDDEITRSRNRRVELMVTGRELDDLLNDSLTEYQTIYESASGNKVSN